MIEDDRSQVEKRDKIKSFLIAKQAECEMIILKYKRTYNGVRAIYYVLMITSIVGSTILSIVSSYTFPPLAIGIISGITAIITAISLKLNMENMKIKLNKKIHNLNKIKDKLDYVITCNGNLSEDECNRILNDFRSL